MTVLIGDEPVNSGNTGWTKSDVLTALEKVFYELGWNSGTQKNGVPVCCKWPNWDSSTIDMGTYNGNNDGCYNDTTAGNWRTCGGQLTTRDDAYRYLYIRNDGTNAYLIKEKISIQGYPNVTTDVITSTHAIGLPDGQEVIWAPGETAGDATKDIGGLTHGQTYYLGFESNYPVDMREFKLYNSNADALAKNNPVDITSNPANPYPLWTPEQSNPTLNVCIGDRLYWVLDDTSGGQFYWMDMTEGGYVSDRSIHGNPFVNQYIAGTGISGNGIEGDPYYWNTYYWLQSEDEPFDPTKMAGLGYQGTYSYGYANDTHPNMKGTLIMNADSTQYSYHYSDTGYWKYTVPASGGRSELKLRIYRDLNPNAGSSVKGRVCGITIHSTGEGWSNNEVFTIPASATGGADRGATDIVFGVNAGETSNGAMDGTPSIHVTNLGAGQNMFQKHPNGDYGILRLENDDSKNFGVTYWSFSFRNDNYRMFINNGIGWNYLNRLGEHCPNDSTGQYYGKFQGEVGLDLGTYPWPQVAETSTNYDPRYFASTSTPTSYPLHIRYYKAQAPQDDNFAVIQFTQTINTEVRPFFTFALHAGPNFGAGIYDLDDQFTGSYTQFITYDSLNGSTGSNRGRWVQTEYRIPGYGGGSVHPQEEPAEESSRAREGSYGWLRNSSGNSDVVPVTKYECNIDTWNQAGAEVVTYFRDSAWDKLDHFALDVDYVRFKKDGLVGMPSSSDYYKPIKGIPISNQLVPCPYYMPDDFTMLQVAVQPGQVEFRTGDQVDISPSEKYKIIIGDNQKDQNGLDNINNNTAIGMLFCARIT